MALEDLYWNPVDFDSLPHPSKRYVDPWDLENYAYIRNHLRSSDDSSSTPSSSFNEPLDTHTSSFYYVPTVMDTTGRYDSLVTTDRSNYCAIDELTLGRNDRQKMRRVSTGVDEGRGSRRKDLENPAFNESNQDSSLLYIYETKGRCRKMAMPSRNMSAARERSMSFSYGDNGYDVYVRRPQQEIYNRPEDIYSPSEVMTSYSVYDDLQRINRPRHFGLSNYGHLQIDYSYSWNNLDEYIHN